MITILNKFFSKPFFLLLFVVTNISFCYWQNLKQASDYGFRFFQIVYKGDPVNILVKSAKGRILTIITRNRRRETDSAKDVEANFKYGEEIVQKPGNLDASKGENNGMNFLYLHSRIWKS